MAENRLQVRVPGEVADWLRERAARMHGGSADLQARTELGMWRGVLEMELKRIRLTLAQASCLADILNSTMLEASLGRIVYMEAADAFAIARDTPVPDMSSYAAKWGLDEQQLLEWLSRLSPAADHALRDAIARWWDADLEPTVDGFAKVGLIVIDTTPSRGEEPDA